MAEDTSSQVTFEEEEVGATKEWVRRFVKKELEAVRSSMKTRKKPPSLLSKHSKKILAQNKS